MDTKLALVRETEDTIGPAHIMHTKYVLEKRRGYSEHLR